MRSEETGQEEGKLQEKWRGRELNKLLTNLSAKPFTSNIRLILTRLDFFWFLSLHFFWAQDSSFLQTSSTTKTSPIHTQFKLVFVVITFFLLLSQQGNFFCRLTKLGLEIYEPLVG